MSYFIFEFNIAMNSIEIIKNCNKIVITGGVGVGKTTTINLLKELLEKNGIKCVSIPEYLDASEEGRNMLMKYSHHEISAYDFQSYIVNYFNDYLTSLNLEGNELMIFERVPDDTITCFSNMWNKQGLLTDDQLYKLYKESLIIGNKFNLPSYFVSESCEDIIHMLLNTNSSEYVARQIYNEIINRNLTEEQKGKSIIIGLYNTPQTCLERIIKRGRKEEIETYTLETIKQFNKHYTAIYEMFMNGGRLRFCDIGKLIE